MYFWDGASTGSPQLPAAVAQCPGEIWCRARSGLSKPAALSTFLWSQQRSSCVLQRLTHQICSFCIMYVPASSELCCFPAEPWITERKGYPADKVKSISFKTCRNASHHCKGSRITLINTRKGHRLRQTEANLQLQRLVKASHADLRLSKWHFTQLRGQDLCFGCLTEEHRETPLRSALPCLASLEVQRKLWTLTRFPGIQDGVLILSSAQN